MLNAGAGKSTTYKVKSKLDQRIGHNIPTFVITDLPYIETCRPVCVGTQQLILIITTTVRLLQREAESVISE